MQITGDRRKTRLGVLISGRGSNLLALAEAAKDPGFGASVELVIADRADAAGLQAAKDRGIECCVIECHDFASRHDRDAAISGVLQAHRIELVALAGFMSVLGADFVRDWSGRLVNIHPSLLPAYPGLDTHVRALQDRAIWHGCSVHWVTAKIDAGPIIAQARLRIAEHDDPQGLAARVLQLEHLLYPACISGLARNAEPQDTAAAGAALISSRASSFSSR